MQRLNEERIRFTDVVPNVQCGQFAVKRVQGESLTVSANIFHNGIEALGAAVRYRHDKDTNYHHVAMQCMGEDRWQASFPLEHLGGYQYSIVAWTDAIATWQRNLKHRWEAGERQLQLDFQDGASLLRALMERVPRGSARVPLMQAALLLGDPTHPPEESILIALNPVLAEISADYPDPAKVVTTEQPYPLLVEPLHSRFASWYQLFPRSQSLTPGKHGTLRDVLRRLPELRDLGFDVLLLPPIHPIGLTNRKGKTPGAETEAHDLGSPWAVGNWQGGHDAIEPALGTLDDFRMLLGAAQAHHMHIALELTLHCSPDHPYVKACPHWLAPRPDGSFALQDQPSRMPSDGYWLDFDNPDWPSLWQEVLRLVRFWIEQGVRMFYVDSPHTRPIGFWEWLIGQVKRLHPEVVFQAGSICKPGMSQELARIGFSQCLSPFFHKEQKSEIEGYIQEITHGELPEFYRPLVFTNTPQHLPAMLRRGSRAKHGTPASDGSTRYAPSEIYEIVQRPSDMPGSLRPLIQLLNQTRRSHPALQKLNNVTFHRTTNPHLISYSKATENHSDRFIIVVNLDPAQPQEGYIDMRLDAIGLPSDQVFLLHDLLTNQSWTWHGSRNYVRLDPDTATAHICNVRVPVFRDMSNTDLITVPPNPSEESTSDDTDVDMPALQDSDVTRQVNLAAKVPPPG